MATTTMRMAMTTTRLATTTALRTRRACTTAAIARSPPRHQQGWAVVTGSMIRHCPQNQQYRQMATRSACALSDCIDGQPGTRTTPFQRSSSTLWFSTASSDDQDPTKDAVFDVRVDYRSPLGELISRLKMVSITGCFLSVCVMPALVFLKNGDLPNAQQATMGGIATLGATGSTAALHFVFGSYVLEMKTVSSHDVEDNSDGEESTAAGSSSHPQWLLQATTRSVFGFWKHTYVFDPTRDITAYQGNRPFANFCANGVPLYVHPEKLDDRTKQFLLQPGTGGLLSKSAASGADENRNRDSEGLSRTQTKQKKEDDDELF